MKEGGVTMEVGNDAVAILTISNPPVNVLSAAIFDRLKELLTEAMGRDDVKAVVLIGNGGKFSGGFDVNIFERAQKAGDISIIPDVSVELFVNVIEDAKKPVVAALEGPVLGGALELAMSCHARIAATKTQLCLPELILGVIPGSGGTTRLPRLIGLPKALEMLLLSRSITSEEGNKLGLVDAVVPSEELLKVSRQWALDITVRRKPWIRSLHRTDKLGSLFEAFTVIKKAKQQVKLTAKNMPQHQACLDVIEEGVIYGGYHGILKELKVFRELVFQETSKGLVHSFLSQRATTKLPIVNDIGRKPRPVKKVAVIGGGLMGSGIATALILGDISVLLKEINSEYLLKGIKTVEANIRGLELTDDKAEKALMRLKGVVDYSEFKYVDMAIEAVNENIALKQKIFADTERACPPHCILASNTSTIDLNIVGEKTKSKDRIVGAHFFSPAHIMPLLEIVRTEKTSSQVVLDLMTVAKTIHKVPIVVENCTGFAVNRTFFPYSQSAHLLVNLGIDVFRIDRLIGNFGFPIGPFQLQDLAGYGVAVATTKQFSLSYPDRTFESPLLNLLIQNGRNGCKCNGKGYYVYEKGSKPKPDSSVLPVIEESRRLTNVMPGGKPISVTDEEIVKMILFPVVNEACRVLDDGIVIRASDLDVASILGMSFPSYRGGVIFWADTIGADHVYTSLEKWSKLYGNFFRPSKFLEERAKRGIPLVNVFLMLTITRCICPFSNI
ncbi:PREDICTED: peroxisomal fatty acid beta-oxidation multifunctional protein AIM1-like isoform X4 [Erythranthe guttata]|uniref:peroxisomal fatty acid beta-oxidation multifunctional protein AIM1-like isoform X4 n=1 Tax=Erythranthe guttata TaxID=4155 RepID=UPI00064D985F|nr:PREDICTED: peroxisomal fatty acid beta-oxidation multifunctional protein AIM1-like isoform X4 [Erythranthe guttata]|eukprot:XP_012846457.1 PREDICTED: peroxisomal fatty acid beta-oxidation multifunctional protein AIM1-like isoform X4 [Erythranthe guttata]